MHPAQIAESETAEMSNFMGEARKITGIQVSAAGAPLAPKAAADRLLAAGFPAADAVVDFFSQVDGVSIQSEDTELVIFDLDELLRQDAWQHMLENSGMDGDEEEAEDFAPYHVFAKGERTLVLVNLRTLETAVAFDLDVTALSLSFAQLVEALLEQRFASAWYQPYEV